MERLIVTVGLILMALPGLSQSTTIRIRFANGKNGKPLAVKYIKVGGGGYDLTDYRVEKVEKYSIVVTFKDKKAFSFRDEGYYRCDSNSQTAPEPQYNLQEIAEHGIVAPNVCGSVHAQPKKR